MVLWIVFCYYFLAGVDYLIVSIYSHSLVLIYTAHYRFFRIWILGMSPMAIVTLYCHARRIRDISWLGNIGGILRNLTKIPDALKSEDFKAELKGLCI